jgi:polar amino acid transport system substrate-binding protein
MDKTLRYSTHWIIITGAVCASFFPKFAGAEDKILRVSLGRLPAIADSPEIGILPDLFRAYQKVYPEGTLKIDVVPFKRSIENVLTGKADLHGPILKDPTKTEKELGFSLSDANIWTVTFALYVNRNKKPVDPKHLEGLRIETDSAHVGYFNFPVQPSSCLECSLKKVDSGRIDGFIFAALECDTIIKKTGLKNIKSHFFRTYEGKFILPVGEQGQKTNKIISQLTDRVRKNGDYQKALGPILRYYENWKPLP